MTKTMLDAVIADLTDRQARLQAQLAAIDHLLVELPTILGDLTEPAATGTKMARATRERMAPTASRRRFVKPPEPSQLDQAILAHVTAQHGHAPAGLACGRIAKDLKRPLVTVWGACQRLTKAGRLVRDGRLYRLASKKPTPVNEVVWNGEKSRAGKLLTNQPAETA